MAISATSLAWPSRNIDSETKALLTRDIDIRCAPLTQETASMHMATVLLMILAAGLSSQWLAARIKLPAIVCCWAP